LRRVGIVPKAQVTELATELYARRTTEINGVTVRIICFAETIGDDLQAEGWGFIPWTKPWRFIQKPFAGNARLKGDHNAWDEFGKFLWRELSAHTPTVDEFFHAWDAHPRG